MIGHFGPRIIRLLSPQLKGTNYAKQMFPMGKRKLGLTLYSISDSSTVRNFSQPSCNFNSGRTHHYANYLFVTSQLLARKKEQRVNELIDSKINQERYFSTIVWLLVKPFLKVIAIILGRIMRKRFLALSPENKQRMFNLISDNSCAFSSALGAVVLLAIIYYFAHVEETPITRRKRMITFSKEDTSEIAQFQADVLVELFKSSFIPAEDKRVQRVVRVAKKILDANPEAKILTQNWKLYVINNSLVNAFVVQTGQIFVFSGILSISDSDDQLAIILGHEMAHAVLSHGVEALSLGSFVDWFIVIGFAAIWFLIHRDLRAIFTTCLFDKAVNLVTLTRANRMQEWEADHVGLLFAANACYDIREAGVLWRKIAKQQSDQSLSNSLPSWLTTHPDSVARAEYLDSLLSDAEGWRKAHGCPPLPKSHPRMFGTYIEAEQ